MVQYLIDIYVQDWSTGSYVPGANVTMNGISKITDDNGYVQFAQVDEGTILLM